MIPLAPVGFLVYHNKMHPEAYNAVSLRAQQTQLANKKQWGLDLGGQYVNGSCRDLFPNTTWVGLDIVPGPGIDIVTDATVWEPEDIYDVILCTEVLEHVERWQEIVRVCSEALVEGGTLFLTCASTHRPPHGANGESGVPSVQHYGNVDPEPLREIAEKYFSKVDVEYNYPPGDAYMVAVR